MNIKDIICETAIKAIPDIGPVKQIFDESGVVYNNPTTSTVKHTASNRDFKHPGVYMIFTTDINSGLTIPFYIGKSDTGGVSARFETHWNKLSGDLSKAWKAKESGETFPKSNIDGQPIPIEWRIGMAQQVFGIPADPKEYAQVIPTGEYQERPYRPKPNNKDYDKWMQAGLINTDGIKVDKDSNPEMRKSEIIRVEYPNGAQLTPVNGRNPDAFPVFVWRIDKKVDGSPATSADIKKIEEAMIALYNPLCNADKDKGSSDKIKGKLPSELQSLMGKLASQPAGRYAAEHMKIVKKYYAVSKGPDGKREFTPLTPQETKNTQVTKAANKKATNTQQSKPIVSPVSQQPNPAMANWKAINANPQVQAALGNLYGRGKIEASQFLQQQARQISDTSAVAANIPKILQKLNQFAELAENKKD